MGRRSPKQSRGSVSDGPPSQSVAQGQRRRRSRPRESVELGKRSFPNSRRAADCTHKRWSLNLPKRCRFPSRSREPSPKKASPKNLAPAGKSIYDKRKRQSEASATPGCAISSPGCWNATGRCAMLTARRLSGCCQKKSIRSGAGTASPRNSWRKSWGFPGRPCQNGRAGSPPRNWISSWP